MQALLDVVVTLLLVALEFAFVAVIVAPHWTWREVRRLAAAAAHPRLKRPGGVAGVS
ncbi:MAG: hypothetical protein QOK19_1468 [Solirubrobacteraceae bacterium]|nr:hypothetical protein [Solirubrobacteraceae bacterium]